MVKRALFFSTPYSLSLRDNQMIIRTKEAPDMQRTVPVEDIAAGGTDGEFTVEVGGHALF